MLKLQLLLLLLLLLTSGYLAAGPFTAAGWTGTGREGKELWTLSRLSLVTTLLHTTLTTTTNTYVTTTQEKERLLCNYTTGVLFTKRPYTHNVPFPHHSNCPHHQIYTYFQHQTTNITTTQLSFSPSLSQLPPTQPTVISNSMSSSRTYNTLVALAVWTTSCMVHNILQLSAVGVWVDSRGMQRNECGARGNKNTRMRRLQGKGLVWCNRKDQNYWG